jgi:hypothetical protein
MKTTRAAIVPAAVAVLAALAVLAGCSGKPPVISRVYARTVYVHDTRGGVDAETLGVFLVASDPDGAENLSAFYVINDDADLFWKVDNGSWVSITAEGETWIGTTSLTVPRTATLPSGSYRVVLQSAGGDTVEDTFTLPPRTESADEAVYPTATVSHGVITITGRERSYEIWIYDKGDRFMASVPAPGRHPSVPVKSLAAASGLQDNFSFRVYALDPEGGYGVLAGPYPAFPAAEK